VRGRIKTPAARKPLFARNRAREEVGVEVEVLELVGTYSLADSSLTCHVFRCAIVQGKPEAQPGDEIAEARWVPPDALPSPRTNALHHALEDVLAGRTGVARSNLPRIS
jgi:ADP-ribose pyrophosphatase YjhB (NUDIX family)